MRRARFQRNAVVASDGGSGTRVRNHRGPRARDVRWVKMDASVCRPALHSAASHVHGRGTSFDVGECVPISGKTPPTLETAMFVWINDVYVCMSE